MNSHLSGNICDSDFDRLVDDRALPLVFVILELRATKASSDGNQRPITTSNQLK